jgi:hypothetical protein
LKGGKGKSRHRICDAQLSLDLQVCRDITATHWAAVFNSINRQNRCSGIYAARRAAVPELAAMPLNLN